MIEAVVEFNDVSRIFETPTGRVSAVEKLSFGVSAGQYVCIVGRTGCGKSTTINMLLGLDRPTSGRIGVLGADPVRDFAALRGRIGCVFQTDRLLPWRTALDNVRLPIEVLGLDEDRLPISPRDWLARVGLAGFENTFPERLSGGMRQRVALARALVSNPEIVLADEAFGHLDEVTAHQLRNDFKALARESGRTVLHITHSIEEAITLADRVLVFGRPGHVAADIDVGSRSESPAALRDEIYATIERAYLGGMRSPVERRHDVDVGI